MSIKEEFENQFGYKLHNPAFGYGVSLRIIAWVERKIEVAMIQSVAYKGKLKREAYQMGYQDGYKKCENDVAGIL
jgi:hypothetical protein